MRGTVTMKQQAQSTAGFTLVEIAVVMIIIGVLIAGLVFGIQFYDHTRRVATVTKVTAFQQSVEEFIGQYDALPGDMPNAQNRLALCDAPCVNGDGNGVIGSGNQNIDFGGAPNGVNAENVLFWYHLQAAGLINVINIDGPLNAGWGDALPAAPANGGYTVRSMGGFQDDANGQNITGLYIRWQDTPHAAANANGNFVISPEQARGLDEKLDDGLPTSGKVCARGNAGGVNANDGCRNGNAYLDGVAAKTCFMYFRIRESSGL